MTLSDSFWRRSSATPPAAEFLLGAVVDALAG